MTKNTSRGVVVTGLVFCDHEGGCDFPATCGAAMGAGGYPISPRCDAHAADAITSVEIAKAIEGEEEADAFVTLLQEAGFYPGEAIDDFVTFGCGVRIVVCAAGFAVTSRTRTPHGSIRARLGCPATFEELCALLRARGIEG